MLLHAWMALFPTAHAFCGTYVGQAGTELLNQASQLVFVREGNTTTLTLANDVSADTKDFGLLIPVPQVLDADDVRVVSPTVVTDLERYSNPRLVRYTCEDVAQPSTAVSCGGEAPSSRNNRPFDESELEKAVTVEAEFTVGEYDIVILSATESDALVGWLDNNGFAVSGDAAALLQEYIDSNTYFLAARVSLDELPTDATYLSPLQIRYRSLAMTLPIRLGTLNSSGVQDFLLYALNDQQSGELHIANYPRLELEDDCMLQDGQDANFDQTWASTLDDTFGDQAGWILEYAWWPTQCDPCPEGGALDPALLVELGYGGDPTSAFFTRLHMRYRPEQVTEDLVLYSSGIYSTEQVRYISYLRELETEFPICGLGWMDPDLAGRCEGTTPGVDPTHSAVASPSCASARGGRAWAGMAVLWLGLALWRRSAHRG